MGGGGHYRNFDWLLGPVKLHFVGGWKSAHIIGYESTNVNVSKNEKKKIHPSRIFFFYGPSKLTHSPSEVEKKFRDIVHSLKVAFSKAIGFDGGKKIEVHENCSNSPYTSPIGFRGIPK